MNVRQMHIVHTIYIVHYIYMYINKHIFTPKLRANVMATVINGKQLFIRYERRKRWTRVQ